MQFGKSKYRTDASRRVNIRRAERWPQPETGKVSVIYANSWLSVNFLVPVGGEFNAPPGHRKSVLDTTHSRDLLSAHFQLGTPILKQLIESRFSAASSRVVFALHSAFEFLVKLECDSENTLCGCLSPCCIRPPCARFDVKPITLPQRYWSS